MVGSDFKNKVWISLCVLKEPRNNAAPWRKKGRLYLYNMMLVFILYQEMLAQYGYLDQVKSTFIGAQTPSTFTQICYKQQF